ncbi:MAG: hypothetical protein K6G90_01430 [Clostridia bacterium]|nr:hypothetical protein [Clostridia bacterium]
MDWDKLMDPSLIEDECPIASDQYYEEADNSIPKFDVLYWWRRIFGRG